MLQHSLGYGLQYQVLNRSSFFQTDTRFSQRKVGDYISAPIDRRDRRSTALGGGTFLYPGGGSRATHWSSRRTRSGAGGSYTPGRSVSYPRSRRTN